MEKMALLKDAQQALPGGDYSTLNTSKAGSFDMGVAGMKESRREDLTTIDELNDQIRTKEEEIQILWNVIKEVNKLKGGSFNVSQLQKLVIRSEAAALAQSNHSERQTLMFATPAHCHQNKRY